MARITPIVRGDTLRYQRDGLDYQVPVGTPDWYAWLDTATSFAFRSPQGSFTARRERSGNKRGGWYWKAYIRRKGKLLHAYLGKAETLTLEHMCSVAVTLTRENADTLVDDLQEYPDQHVAALFPVSSHRTNVLPLPEQEVQSILHAQLTEIIGREQETRTACLFLQRADVRLVTITGPAGVGKTRLALHVADTLAESFADGVCCVSLASLVDPALVVPTIAQELGLIEVGEVPVFSRLKAFLHEKHLLLFLDNFEQVIAAAPLLTELLAACSQLKILVTSREVLHIRIEHELLVPPLALPDIEQLPDVEQLSHYASVALFVQRAMAVKADFQITAANAQAIAEICTRLDGLPLAIELAAARIKLLSPQALLTRLSHRLQVLTGGARDLPRRQQTLRDTLTWSYDLLDAEEQRIFRSLAVFVRGCALEAAEVFCHTLYDDSELIFRCIASLIDKNLLQRVEQASGEVRLMMLETVREYALECLVACDENATVHQAHAHYYLTLVEQAGVEIRRAQQVAWLNLLEQEYDNVRAALSWFLEQRDLEQALRMCGALWLFWSVRNRRGEGYQWVERVLARVAQDKQQIPLRVRAKACYAAGILADSQGFYQHGMERLQESLKLYQECSDQAGSAAALNKLGHVYARNATSEAHDLYEKSLALARKWHDQYGIADALASLADEALALGDFANARGIYQECLDVYRVLGDKRSIAYCLSGLGQVAANEGKHVEAYARLQESLLQYPRIGAKKEERVSLSSTPSGNQEKTHRPLDSMMNGHSTAYALLQESLTVPNQSEKQNEIARYLGILGETALQQKSENDAARTLLEESLAIFRETGNEEGIASKLYALGSIEFAQGNFNAARKFLDESIIFFRKLENLVMTASALHMLGHVESHKGNYAQARIFMEESVLISRHIGDRWNIPSRLCYLGLVALNEGKHAEARTLLEESLATARKIGDRRILADSLSVIGLVSLNQGNYAAAQRELLESMEFSQEREDRYSMAYRLADLGMLAIRQGDWAKARPLVEEALAISIEISNRWFTASCLERLGEIAVEQGQAFWAVQLWGAAAAIREDISAPIPPIELLSYNHAVEVAHTQLSAEAFTMAWNAGYTQTPEQVLAGREQDTWPDIQQNDQPHMPGNQEAEQRLVSSNRHVNTLSLTNREIEVLSLVAKGFTNARIAEQLVISPRTVQTHLSSIYGKIGVTSRSAATRYAIEHRIS